MFTHQNLVFEVSYWGALKVVRNKGMVFQAPNKQLNVNTF